MASNTSMPNATPGISQPINLGLSEQFGAMQSLPNSTSLAENVPGLNVPGMDQGQQDALTAFLTNSGNNPDLAAARSQIGALTSGPVGSSPETQAGMKAYQDLAAPQIASDSALRGTASGGQGIEALALGQEQAAVPLIQQEIQNRSAAVGQDMGIASQQQQSLAQALEASGLPREVALQQAEAAFQQQQQQWGTQMGIQQLPLSWAPAANIGNTSHTTMDAMDYVGAAGKGLQGPLAGMMSGGGGGG